MVPDIPEPYPIKPVWPARPERKSENEKRKAPPPKKEPRERRPERREDEEGGPHIDEFV